MDMYEDPISFRQSEHLEMLLSSLVEFQDLMEGVERDSTAEVQMRAGGSFKYSYSTLGKCWQTAKEKSLLKICGLAVTQTMGFYETRTGELVDVLYTLLGHTNGQWKEGKQILRHKTDDMQGQGSSITYARRYGFCAVLGLSPEDDDAASATQEHRTRSSTQQRPAAAASDLPPCPQCGKALRRDKSDPSKVYCWTKFQGCGYDSSRDAAPEDDLEAGNYTTNPKAAPLKTGDQVTDTDPSPNEAAWAELKRSGIENKWPEAYMKQSIDMKRRQGMTPAEIFNECWEKWTKPNGRAVDDSELSAAGMTEEELPF